MMTCQTKDTPAPMELKFIIIGRTSGKNDEKEKEGLGLPCSHIQFFPS